MCSLGGPDAAAGGPDAVAPALSPPVPGRIVYEFPTPTSETSGLGLGGLDALQALLADVATAEGAAPVLLSMEPALSYRLAMHRHPEAGTGEAGEGSGAAEVPAAAAASRQ